MTGELTKALVDLQANLPAIEKSQTAKVQTQKGRDYEYQYANLTAISEAILPLLSKHGLAFIAKPAFRDGAFVLAYSLLHISGEREDGEYPLPTTGTPQAIGSAITYGRRYCLCAVTGIAPDTMDDDGAAAEAEASRGTAQRRRQPAKKSAEPQKTAQRASSRGGPPPLPGEDGPPEDQPGDGITNAQMSKLHASFADLGVTNRDDGLKYIANVIGHDVDSSKQLTKVEASKVIDAQEQDIAEKQTNKET